jgi:NTE family protein
LRAGWDTYRIGHVMASAPPSPERKPRGPWPASGTYLRAVLARPWLARIGPLVAALLPEGAHDTVHLGETLHDLLPHWPHLPLWIPAVHADSGARVVFGREDAPLIDVATAVRCSSAVPGMRRPVEVGEKRYVNGGVHSPTSADLAAHAEVAAERRRTVIVLSPLSRLAALRVLLRWELRPLVRHGIDVMLFEPDRDVSAAMGWNPLDGRRASAVAEAAYHATRTRLERSGVAAAVCMLMGTNGGGT